MTDIRTTDQIKADQEKLKQEMLKVSTRLTEIDAKSNCGGVKFLDEVANVLDSIANALHRSADKIRNRVDHMSPICTFKSNK